MDKVTLLDRISKKEESIAKINRRIDKWKKQCPEGHIEIAEQFRHSTYSEFAHYCKEHNIPYSFTPVDELRRAYQDLDESEITLSKYKNQLILIEQKEGVEKIPVLVEFFEKYKKQNIKFIEFNMNTLLEYYKINSEYCNAHNYRHRYMEEERLDEEEYKRKLNALKDLQDDLKAAIHPITFSVYSRDKNNPVDYDKLNEILDKDIEAKYWNMVEKVTKITGEIIDMSAVSVGGDGNLNGIVIGQDGKAKLETILAGGYNHNVILDSGRRGQILHYRLLIHQIKE